MKENDLKARFQSGAQVLHSLFQNVQSPLSEPFARWKLWAQWEKVVGPNVAEHSEPVGLYKGVLYLWVSSSSMHQQMQFLKPQILESIQRKAGINFIKDIQFTRDRKAVPKSEEGQQEIKKFISALKTDQD